MFPTPLKTFVHPKKVYKLEYPAHWDQVVKDDGASCGFGPHDREDVGLWISLMPQSVDTDRLKDDLPKLMGQAIAEEKAKNMRKDESLRHFGMVADMTEEGEGGHYWLLAGGDVVLFVSSQVPVAERDVWNPPFLKLMASLQITRDTELLMGRVAHEVLTQLKKRYPDQEFAMEGNNIRGKNQLVYLGNVLREVKASPSRQAKIIENFVERIAQPSDEDLGLDDWPVVQENVLPVLKPREYIRDEGATKHIHFIEWLSDVVICYVIRSKKLHRFVTGWDLRRWEITQDIMHEQALKNLTALPWPKGVHGARFKDSGRLVLVETDDNLAASRLLHPDLYQTFSPILGTPFWAGVPSRDTLVLFSNRKELKQRIGRRLRKDCKDSAYSITPEPFLVTRDGIAPAAAK